MKRVLWTDREKKDLINLASIRRRRKLDWKALHKRFPHRTKKAIHLQIVKLGVQSKLWTREQDQLLRSLWGSVSPKVLRSRFRGVWPWDSVQGRAKILGLRKDIPQGMVSIYNLSRDPKWGYCYAVTRGMFQWAEVKMTSFRYSGKNPKRFCVDEVEALEAAARWAKSEVPEQASDRLNVSAGTLRKWLQRDGHYIPNKANPRRFRADPEFYDRLYAKHLGSVPGEKKQQKVHQDCGESATQ